MLHLNVGSKYICHPDILTGYSAKVSEVVGPSDGRVSIKISKSPEICESAMRQLEMLEAALSGQSLSLAKSAYDESIKLSTSDTSICEATKPKESTMRLEVCPGDGGWIIWSKRRSKSMKTRRIRQTSVWNWLNLYDNVELFKDIFEYFHFSCLVSFSNSILWFRSYCWTQLLNSMSHQYFCVWLLYFKGVPLIYQ